MKILHLINTLDRGGAENHLYCLARGQNSSGNDVHIIYLKGNDYWSKDLMASKIKVSKLNHKFSFFRHILYIRNYINQNEYL